MMNFHSRVITSFSTLIKSLKHQQNSGHFERFLKLQSDTLGELNLKLYAGTKEIIMKDS